MIARLGAEDFADREEASRKLQETLPQSAPQLKTALTEANDMEIRWRLKRLLLQSADRQDVKVLLPQLLRNMYSRHLTKIWKEYFELLE